MFTVGGAVFTVGGAVFTVGGAQVKNAFNKKNYSGHAEYFLHFL